MDVTEPRSPTPDRDETLRSIYYESIYLSMCNSNSMTQKVIIFIDINNIFTTPQIKYSVPNLYYRRKLKGA